MANGGFEWANLVKTDNTGNVQAKREEIKSPFTKENMEMISDGIENIMAPDIAKEKANKEREVLSNFNKTKEIERQKEQSRLEKEKINTLWASNLITEEEYSRLTNEIENKYSLAGVNPSVAVEYDNAVRRVRESDSNNKEDQIKELNNVFFGDPNSQYGFKINPQDSSSPNQASSDSETSTLPNNTPNSSIEQIMGAKDNNDLADALTNKIAGVNIDSLMNDTPETRVQQYMQNQEIAQLQKQLITDGLGLSDDSKVDENGKPVDAYLDISTSPITGANEIVLNEAKLREKLDKSDAYKDLTEDEKNEAINKEVNKAKLITYASNFQSNNEALILKDAEKAKQDLKATTQVAKERELKWLQDLDILPKDADIPEAQEVSNIFGKRYGMSPSAAYSYLSQSNKFSYDEWVRAYQIFNRTNKTPSQKELEAFKVESYNIQILAQNLRNIDEAIDRLNIGYSLIDAIAADKFRETAYYVNDMVAREIFEEKFASKQTTYNDYYTHRNHQATIRDKLYPISEHKSGEMADQVTSAMRTSSNTETIESTVKNANDEKNLNDVVTKVARDFNKSENNATPPPKVNINGTEATIDTFFGGNKELDNVANITNQAERKNKIKDVVLSQMGINKKDLLISLGVNDTFLKDDASVDSVWNQFINPGSLNDRFNNAPEWLKRESEAYNIWANQKAPLDYILNKLYSDKVLDETEFNNYVNSVTTALDEYLENKKINAENKGKNIQELVKKTEEAAKEYLFEQLKREQENPEHFAENPKETRVMAEGMALLQFMPVISGPDIFVIGENNEVQKIDIFDNNQKVSLYNVKKNIESVDETSNFLTEIDKLIERGDERGTIIKQKINAIAAGYMAISRSLGLSPDDIALLAIDTYLDIEGGDTLFSSGGGAGINMWSGDLKNVKPSHTRFPLLPRSNIIEDDIITTKNNSNLNLSNADKLSEFKYNFIQTILPNIQNGNKNTRIQDIYKKMNNNEQLNNDEIEVFLTYAAQSYGGVTGLLSLYGIPLKPLTKKEQERQRNIDANDKEVNAGAKKVDNAFKK